jgi:hypothetical protein
VAPRASTGTIEILLAGFWVPGLKVRYVYRPPSSANSFAFGFLIVNERDHCLDFGIAYVKCGHAFVHTARPDQRSDFISVRILRNQTGTRQIGPHVASCRITAMA